MNELIKTLHQDIPIEYEMWEMLKSMHEFYQENFEDEMQKSYRYETKILGPLETKPFVRVRHNMGV